jgi:hypothetical protein
MTRFGLVWHRPSLALRASMNGGRVTKDALTCEVHDQPQHHRYDGGRYEQRAEAELPT